MAGACCASRGRPSRPRTKSSTWAAESEASCGTASLRRSLAGSLEAAQHYSTAISSRAPPGLQSLALYKTVATTIPAASRTCAPCQLRIRRYQSELERTPLTRARIAR